LKSLIIVVLISFAFVSCEFDPVGINNLDSVDEKIPVTIVADNDSDTLHLWGVQKITFTAETEGKVFDMNLKIDDSYDHITNGDKLGEFEVDTYRLSNTEEHILTLVCVSESGSGSLADRLGRETNRTEKSWVLIVNNSLPTPKFISGGARDGLLAISWEKFNQENFDSYLLQVNYPYTTRYHEIKDQDSCIYYDSIFFTGVIDFYLRVSDGNNVSEKTHLKFEDNSFFDSFNVEFKGISNIQLSWTKFKYYNNFESYKIYRTGQSQPLFESSDVNDTEFLDNECINLDYNTYGINLKSKNGGEDHQQVSVVAGYESNLVLTGYYMHSNNSLYRGFNNRLERLDAETGELKASHSIINNSRYISFDAYQGTIAYTNQDFVYLLDPNTLEILKQIDIHAILGPNIIIDRTFTWKNNILSFLNKSKYYTPGFTKAIEVIDTDTEQSIGKINSDAYEAPVIANDGKKLVVNNTIYEIRDNGIFASGSITGNGYQTSTGEIVFTNRPNFTIYDENLSNMINVYSFGNYSEFYEDPVSGLYALRSWDSNNLIVIDKQTGNIESSLTASAMVYMFLNSKLYAHLGGKVYYLDI
jgi:hypothetical protein